jgi:hypothetical protein
MDDEELIEELLDIDEDQLNEWEFEFVESVAQWFDERGELSDAQRYKAEEIIEEKGD